MAAKKTCGRPDCACEKKSRMLGRATWLAVVFAIAVVGAALWFSVAPKGAKSQSFKALAVWKPEPKFLLQHASNLRLTAKQLRHIQIVSRAWDMQKAGFDAQFKTYGSDAETALADIQSGKNPGSNYGKLLSAFEAAREKAWENATGTLDGDQVTELDRLRVTPNASKAVSLATPATRVAMLDRSYVSGGQAAIRLSPQVMHGHPEGRGPHAQEISIRPMKHKAIPIPLWKGQGKPQLAHRR